MSLPSLRTFAQPVPAPTTANGTPILLPVPAREQAFGVLEQAIAAGGGLTATALPSDGDIFESLALAANDDAYTHEAQQEMRSFFAWPYLLSATDIAFAFSWQDEETDRFVNIERWISHLVLRDGRRTTVVFTDCSARVLATAISRVAAADNVPLVQALLAAAAAASVSVYTESELLEFALAGASYAGNVSFVQWIANKRGRATGLSEACVTDMMALAALRGHLPVLDWVKKSCPDEIVVSYDFERVVVRAATGNGTAALQWLHDNGLLPVESQKSCWIPALVGAAERGNVSAVQWILSFSSTMRELVLRSSNVGDVRVFWDVLLRTRGKDITTWLPGLCGGEDAPACLKRYLFPAAATANNMNVLQMTEKDANEDDVDRALKNAAGAGHLTACKWIHATRPDDTSDDEWKRALESAVAGGMLHVVIWILRTMRLNMRDVMQRWKKDLVDLAIQRGHIHMLQWIQHDFGLFKDVSVIRAMFIRAAAFEHVDVSAWLVDNYGSEITAKTYTDALENLSMRADASFLTWLLDHSPEKMLSIVKFIVSNEGWLNFQTADKIVRTMHGIFDYAFLDVMFGPTSPLTQHEKLRIVRAMSATNIRKRGGYIVQLTCNDAPRVAVHLLAPSSRFVCQETANALVRLANNETLPDDVRQAARNALMTLLTDQPDAPNKRIKT